MEAPGRDNPRPNRSFRRAVGRRILSEMQALCIGQPHELSTARDLAILTRIRKPSCYSLMVLHHWPDRHKSKMGEDAMTRINRRALLLHSGSAVVASSMTATALGAKPPSRDQEPSSYLRALIEVHKAAYAEFGKALHEIGGGSCDPARASREEERVLLAICGYPAVGEADRLAKARYLLEIEARGELDLAEHMRAVLQSTMLKG
ncbi:hypothetical protein NKH94_29315 [Mesorhizobium australicum]|uniref:hypothetical protein n=1 Tax=Mesorhizobium australicum TaxID=536018 RepID=UPI003334C296